MWRAAVLAAALAALGAAAPAGARTPVAAVSGTVVLKKADTALVRVHCRQRRTCVGLLSLGVPERNLPVGCPACNVGIGGAEFRIRGRSTRTVAVRRGDVTQPSDDADALDVWAVATLRRERLQNIDRIARRQRRVRLVAPPELQRPRVPLALTDIVSRWGLGPDDRDDNALRFRVQTRRGTDSVRVEFRDRTLDLHPSAEDGPYLVPAHSFAPAGVAFHGELPIARGDYRYGESYPLRIIACAGAVCETLTTDSEVSVGNYGYGGPICRLRLPDGTTRVLHPQVVAPDSLAALTAAPAPSL